VRKLLVGALIALIVIGVISGWYAFLGGREYIDTQLLGQEAVVVELTVRYMPITSSPISDLEIEVEAEAHRARISRGVDLTLDAKHKAYSIREVSGDRVAEYGAQVHFTKKITIINATGDVIFERTLELEKGADMVITIYGTTDELKPGTDITIIVDISMSLTLPVPENVPEQAPRTIERTIHREITTQIED